MAEVFTPSWVCNEQNNLLDEGYFGRKNVFNVASNKTWTITNKIECEENQWKEYVKALMLEITCGECPYLVSRYDTVTGDTIDLFSRIGLFDRKMRIVCEKVGGGSNG